MFETFLVETYFTPLSPWLMHWSLLAAVVVGGCIGAIEAFYECKLHRAAPWGRLCSRDEKRKSPR